MAESIENINSINNKISNPEKARILISRIRKELCDAENHFIDSNAHWEEVFYDVEIISDKNRSYEHKDLIDNDLGYNFNKIYRPNMGSKIDSNLRSYYPLRMFYFDDQKAICNVYGILWDNITTRRSKRDLYVRNDGLIVLNKYGRNVSYKLKYDVKDESYAFSIKRHNEYDFIDFSHSNDCVTKSLNNIKVLYNLSDNTKVVSFKDINRKNNFATEYLLFYDRENKLSKVRIMMDIIKENGRTGNYFMLDITKNGVQSYYINRKGMKSELSERPEKALKFGVYLSNEYRETLNNGEPSDFNNLKLYALEKAISANPLTEEGIVPVVKDALLNIDNSITAYLGEIPFPNLDRVMRKDMNYTRERLFGREYAYIKNITD